MAVDIILLSIISLFVVAGYKKGALAYLFNLFKLGIILVATYFITPYVQAYVREHTNALAFLREMFISRLGVNSISPQIYDIQPDFFKKSLSIQSENNPIYLVATTISNHVLTVLIFIAVVIFVNIVVSIISRLLTSTPNQIRYLGKFNKIIGGFLGLIFGMLIVYFICLMMYPCISMLNLSNKSALTIYKMIESSIIGKWFYNQNPLYWLISLLSYIN